MNTPNDQTKHHTEKTMVRWTEEQFAILRTEAFKQNKQPAVFIREFILNNCPAFKPNKTDDGL